MPHEFTTGFFVQTAAWHRLGTLFTEADAPKTTREAIIAAGADWSVGVEPIFLKSRPETESSILSGYEQPKVSQSKYSPVPGHKALVRVDTGETLNVVSDKYVPVQNVDAFNFFDAMISSGEASFEAAGTLQGGQTVWVLVKINAPALTIGAGDDVSPYLVLTMGHGNGRAVNITYTAIRVVCMNTVRWAESTAGDKMISIKHVGRPRAALEAVREGVRLSSRSFEIAAETARQLTQVGCDIKGLEQYVREVLETPEDKETPRGFDRIRAAFEYGDGAKLDTARGTMWGAYNAVTNWLDHTRGNSDETRVRSSWMGDSRKVNSRAWEVAADQLVTSAS